MVMCCVHATLSVAISSQRPARGRFLRCVESGDDVDWEQTAVPFVDGGSAHGALVAQDGAHRHPLKVSAPRKRSRLEHAYVCARMREGLAASRSQKRIACLEQSMVSAVDALHNSLTRGDVRFTFARRCFRGGKPQLKLRVRKVRGKCVRHAMSVSRALEVSYSPIRAHRAAAVAFGISDTAVRVVRAATAYTS